ncbi:hypothetical protein CK3_27790 [butyrate-producing bacterium SS3/4]|nr:hypothetical protein CK3_27790 [butyrate-producing bacterium SS3/4]
MFANKKAGIIIPKK